MLLARFAPVIRHRHILSQKSCTAFAGLLLALCAPCPKAFAEDPGEPRSNRPLPAVRLPSDVKPPTIDGDLTDPVWQRAAHAHLFFDPQTSKPASDQTEAYLLYDKDFLYIGFYCHDSQPDGIVARETVRDANMSYDDTVRITLDPFFTRKFNDYAVFVVNPLGTRRTFLGGGRAGKVEWQGDWDAASKRVKDGWTAEMRVPWGILSYPRAAGPARWGLNFRRFQARTKIESMWCDLGTQYFNDRDGQWEGVEAPVRAWRPRLSFLPYAMPIAQAGGGRSQFRSGLDARYQPTPELTGVATLNPDFQSVEGAVESIAFSRSEVFVPDKRPFFVEGSDYLYFGEDYQLGYLFDSSRIQAVDGGAKVYGKLSPRLTLGTLGTVALNKESNFASQIRYDLSPTANARVLMLQRLAPGEDNTVLAFAPQARKGKWSVDGQVVQTLGPNAGGMAWTGAVNLEDKNLFTTIRYRRLGSSFTDRLGYIPFNDYEGWSSFTDWGAEWRHGHLRRFDVNFSPVWEDHLDGRSFRHRVDGQISIETRDDWRFRIFGNMGKFDTDYDFTYGTEIASGVTNRFHQWSAFFITGRQENRPYSSFGPAFSVRLFKKFDVAVGTFVQNFNGITQQHVITFNYELSPYRSWGGRAVIQDANTNFYLSYRNSGRAGTDTYFIIGDPNASRFVKRVMVKFVFAL